VQIVGEKFIGKHGATEKKNKETFKRIRAYQVKKIQNTHFSTLERYKIP
jgi:hypothetical protein